VTRFRRLALLVPALLLSLTGVAAAAVSGHGGPIKAMAVTPDGKEALTGGFDYSVILWDLRTGTPLRRMIGHDAAVDAVAFLPHGRAVSGSDDASLIVWNLEDGRALARWRAHTAKVAAVAVAPDGKTVASGGWDRKLFLWDVAAGRPRPLAGHDDNVNAVAFSPDGKWLASGDYGGKILLWRMPQGELAATLPGNGFPVNALAFTPDGKLLAALADDTVRVFDPAKKRELLRFAGDQRPAVSLAVSRDGALAASGSSDGALVIWRIGTGEIVRSIYATLGPVWTEAFLPGDTRILSAGSDGAIREWAIATGAELSGGQPALAPPSEPNDRGAMLFRKCQACHDFDPGDHAKAGPTFWHLIGRRAGTVAGYPYSPALKASGLVWDEATIDRLFAEGPQAVAPGSKMPLQKMPSAKDRADLIEYLARHAGGQRGVE
jgi:cytochrome c